MSLHQDIPKTNQIAEILYKNFSTLGIHGRQDMPEDILPEGMIRGSLEHVLFLTLTVAIDYLRDAPSLWASARLTFEDPETRYLFHPRSVSEVSKDNIVLDMGKYSLSKKPKQDAFIWQTVAVTFWKKWKGDPRVFLNDCHWDGPTILSRLKLDTHPVKGTPQWDYPYLRGDKIGPLWIRMLRDNANISHFSNLDKIPIPVDIHVARASACLGVIRGNYSGSLNDIFPKIRSAWFEGVKGIQIDNREMIALDVDEPLWHLSKYGCTYRNDITGSCPKQHTCEMKSYCIEGKIAITRNNIEIDT